MRITLIVNESLNLNVTHVKGKFSHKTINKTYYFITLP